MTMQTITPPATAAAAMTTGGLARYLTALGLRTPDGRPIELWMVRRMYESGRVAEQTARLGKYRIVQAQDIPLVVDALRKAGFLPAETTSVPALICPALAAA